MPPIVTRALLGALVSDGDGWAWRDDGAPEPLVAAAVLGGFLPWPPERRLIRGKAMVLLSPRWLAACDPITAAAVAPAITAGVVITVDLQRGATRQRHPGRRVTAVPAAAWERLMAQPDGHCFADVDAPRLIGRAVRVFEADRAADEVEHALDRLRQHFFRRPDPRWANYSSHMAAAWGHVEAALAEAYGPDSPHFLSAERRCWRHATGDLLLLHPDELRRWALDVARKPLFDDAGS